MTKGSNLVIVESPSKAKTIGKYLGPDYRVEACMGHLRDLPKSKMGVDLEHDFEPDYQPLASKAAIISELRSASKAAKHIYLATDPDREGEAISWHLKELLELPDDKTERVTFNEITKNVVTRSIQEPRSIDYNLVDAQQARRILDRIVGYQLSPLLWKKIRRGLSAGRVQSVATRLVVEREQEIEAFVPKEYWTIDVLLRCLNKPGSFTAHYYGEEKKRELHSEAEADEVLRDIAGQEFTIAGIKRTEKRRSPTPPFITSTLQQEASRKLNMTPRRTMAVAQQLYEGVDISGEGTVGLITYMRTDSLRLSEEALAAARDFITDRYGPAYYPGQPRHFRKKEGAQDAHEAIRPSNVRLDPESIQADLTREQYRLYKLIWSRFVACQMSDARYDAVQIDARCAGHAFRASDQILKFSGFTAVYEEGRDDEGNGFQYIDRSAVAVIRETCRLECNAINIRLDHISRDISACVIHQQDTIQVDGEDIADTDDKHRDNRSRNTGQCDAPHFGPAGCAVNLCRLIQSRVNVHHGSNIDNGRVTERLPNLQYHVQWPEPFRFCHKVCGSTAQLGDQDIDQTRCRGEQRIHDTDHNGCRDEIRQETQRLYRIAHPLGTNFV